MNFFCAIFDFSTFKLKSRKTNHDKILVYTKIYDQVEKQLKKTIFTNIFFVMSSLSFSLYVLSVVLYAKPNFQY